jgi:hypothetical protein
MLKQPSANASAIGKNILNRSQGKESAPIIGAGPYYSLGRACLLLGRLDEAPSIGRLCDRSLPATSWYSAHATHLLGDITAHPDRFDPEGGEVHYRETLALAEPRGMRPLVAHCHSASASSTGARASASRRRSGSLPRARCTARWA